MRLSVCMDALFMGRDPLDSIKAIKRAGIDAFEFWCWWDKDLDRIVEVKEELGMDIAAFCTKFVSLVDAARRKDYLDGLGESLKAAKKLACPMLITQVGSELAGVSREKQHESLVEGLKACAPILEDAGVTLVFEPLNTLVDHKGYYLYSSKEAFGIVDEVGSPYVKVLFDIYHQQIMEGNLISTITQNIDKIGHFHTAGNPGRHELNTGEINYDNVFKAIEASSYSGFTGLEYFPLSDVSAELERLAGLYGSGRTMLKL